MSSRFTLFLFLLLGLCFLRFESSAQQCDSIVPSFIANLSNDPNGQYISPQVRRDGLCCGSTGNVKCIEFVVTLHPDAEGVIFDIYSGAVPPGALFYQINCGTPQAVGQPICLNGQGPHVITFCKPGNNINEYRILSVAEPVVPDSIAVNDGCSKELGVTGFDISTIQWTTITDSIGKYDHYLSCTSQCDTVLVTPQPGYPPFIDIEVCGYPFGGCDSIYSCDTVRVNFFSTLGVDILPEFPTICFGDTSISIQAIASGGSPPYTYNWSHGDSTEFTNVNTGTYIIELGDTSGCPPAYDTVTVTAFSLPIEANAGGDTFSCVEAIPIPLSGSVQSASGGTWVGNGMFSPSSDSLNTLYTPDSTEMSTGQALLMLITTGNGTCPADTDFISIDLLKFNATISTNSIPVSCKGDSDGIGLVNASGSRIPYTYEWDANTGSQTGDSAINLAAGLYNVTATDSAGCILDTSVVVIEADSVLSVSFTTTSETCFDSADGTAQLFISGGMPPYTVNWDTSISVFTDTTAFELSSGSYSVTITDDYGCEIDTVFIISGPLAPLTLALSKVNVGCKNGNDGTATVVASGGTAPYFYLWSDSANQTTATATGLTAGLYLVEVTDTMGCIASDTISLNEPPSSISFLDTTVSPSCFGFNDGTATVYPQGGTPPYTFLWDSLANSQTTQTATGLAAGTYSCIISDQNSCVLATPVIVIDPAPLFATAVEIVNVSCKGGADGSARVIATGGTGPFTYQWDSLAGGQTDSIATGLSAGIYSIFVYDQNGCSFIPNIEITEPDDSLSLIVGMSPVSCKGDSNGIAFVEITGGTSPYSIQWDSTANSQTTDTALGLKAGNYVVTVTDSNNCVADSGIEVLEPSLPLVTLTSSVSALCFQDTNGIAIVEPSGGVGPYQIIWDAAAGNQQNDSAFNLTTGTYNALITDANNCTLDTNVFVDHPAPIISSGGKINVTCFGFANGMAYVNASGGNPPYSFQWDANAGNQTNDTAFFLTAGSFNVVVTDNNACQEDTTFVITQPDTFLILTPGKVDVACNGDSNGLAFVGVSGGTPPYSYQWGANAGSQTSDTAFNLKAGTYMITVTDSFGCTDNFAVPIFEPAFALSSAPVKIDLTCFNSADGMAIANAAGGSPPYNYTWTQGIITQNSDTATGLTAGDVVLEITDANGCIIEEDTLNLSEPPEVFVQVSQSDTICLGETATITLNGSGGNGGPYLYRLLPFDTILSPYAVSPVETRIYGFRAIDINGCESATDIVNIVVRDLPSDSMDVVSSGNICLGDTVEITAFHDGIFFDYQYNWNTNEQGLNFFSTPVNSRYYTLTITDICGEEISDSVYVEVYPLPEIELDEIIAEGCVPLRVQFQNLAGDEDITDFLWDFGDGSTSIDPSPVHTFSDTGTYTINLYAENNNGCSSSNDSNSNFVIVHSLPQVSFISKPNLTDMRNPEVQFTSTSSDGDHYWTFDIIGKSTERNPTYIFADTGIYNVVLVVENVFGCLDSITNQVVVNPYFQIAIPNAFTPNLGGSSGGKYDPNSPNNYVFFPVTEGVEEFHMMIFNRWGEMIFESRDHDIGWDGYYRGQLAQQEVYVWKLEVKWENGQTYEGVGDVTLFR